MSNLNVVDISSWNKSNYRDAIDSADAVMIKATEGSTYVNPYLKQYVDYAEQKGKLIGFYHYSRAESCKAIDEVKNFISTVYPYIGKAVFALDWEGKALTTNQSKAREFLDIFYQMTGVKAMVYCSEAYLKKVGPSVVSGDYGLWCAKYSSKKPTISPWKVMAMWQYTNTPWDKSYFYGTATTWNKYAKRS